MSVIRPIEMNLIADLFDLRSGYVLDFTNRTFAEFFQHEVGIDIYDETYNFLGTSKGKRLSAFLQIGTPVAIIKTLTSLWEYREHGLISTNEKDTVNQGRERLNILLKRLGGKPLPEAPNQCTPSAAQDRPWKPSDPAMRELENDFTTMLRMEDAVQTRGYTFERFLKKWFDVWKMDARASFKLIGEQIDGSFEHRGTVYLIEAKWTNSRTDAAALRSFQEKVGDGLEGTRGLFVSYSGFTDQSLVAFKAKRVILMTGLDVFDALRRRISLDEIIAAKFRRGTEERRPLIEVRELFP